MDTHPLQPFAMREICRYPALENVVQCGDFDAASNGRLLVYGERNGATTQLPGEIFLGFRRMILEREAAIQTGVEAVDIAAALAQVPPRSRPCEECKGRKTGPFRCGECGGTGSAECPHCEQDMDCDECDGRGTWGKEGEPCDACFGTGAIPRMQSVKVCGICVDANYLRMVGAQSVFRIADRLAGAGTGGRFVLMPLMSDGTEDAIDLEAKQ